MDECKPALRAPPAGLLPCCNVQYLFIYLISALWHWAFQAYIGDKSEEHSLWAWVALKVLCKSGNKKDTEEHSAVLLAVVFFVQNQAVPWVPRFCWEHFLRAGTHSVMLTGDSWHVAIWLARSDCTFVRKSGSTKQRLQFSSCCWDKLHVRSWQNRNSPGSLKGIHSTQAGDTESGIQPPLRSDPLLFSPNGYRWWKGVGESSALN